MDSTVKRCRAMPNRYNKIPCSQRATETIMGYPICEKHHKAAYKDIDDRQHHVIKAWLYFNDGVEICYDEFGWGIPTPRKEFDRDSLWFRAKREASFGNGASSDSYFASIHIKNHGGHNGDAVVQLRKWEGRPWLMLVMASHGEGEYSDYTEVPYELSAEKAEILGRMISEGAALMREWNG